MRGRVSIYRMLSDNVKCDLWIHLSFRVVTLAGFRECGNETAVCMRSLFIS